MDQLTTTPFGQRPMTAALMERAIAGQGPASVPHTDKWALFREVCTARLAFGVTDRDLTVLNALLSFHQGASLSDNDRLVVFPSNRALCERAHGMAESTLRRHLSALVHAGLIARHDSPNGKRYAARDGAGDIVRAFGFDLRPMLVQAHAIAQAAQATRDAAEHLKRLREAVMLIKRDATKLTLYGTESGAEGPWETLQARLMDLHRQMRRKLDADALEAAQAVAVDILADVRAVLSETKEISGNDDQNERQYQNSNTDYTDFELCSENAKGEGGEEPEPAPHPDRSEPNVPLGLVLKACPDILPYTTEDIRSWHQLIGLAALVRGMMGISPDAWDAAQQAMGPAEAAVTVVAMLQRIDDIKSPGGYLRALTRKAQDNAFSSGPMVMALLHSGSS
ncbi:MAG: plasmid replication protein RepC [Paracoccaceae bacterium]